MAHWNSIKGKIETNPPRLSEFYPGWEVIDCGCCGGLRWGGDSPRECDICGGEGILYRHIKSRVLALYPGGELRGKDD